MNIKEIQPPAAVRARFAAIGSENFKAFIVNGFLTVFVALESGLWHLSVSHPRRYPTWDELRDLRYELLPNDRTFAILFPPKEQYVNIHNNCFHIHEVPAMQERLIVPA